jgi:hypothetical protein
VAVPALLVRGEKDPIVPQSWVEQAAPDACSANRSDPQMGSPQFVEAILPFLMNSVAAHQRACISAIFLVVAHTIPVFFPTSTTPPLCLSIDHFSKINVR